MIENVNPFEVRKELKTLLNVKNDSALVAIVETVGIHLNKAGAYLRFKGTNYFLFAISGRNRAFILSEYAQFYPNLCGLAFELFEKKAFRINPMELDYEIQMDLEMKIALDLRSELLRIISIY